MRFARRPLFRLVLASLLFLGLGAVATVQAQSQTANSPPSTPALKNEGAGFFSVGVQFADLAPLNDRLADAGYPTFTSEMISIGGGGYGVHNRFMIGGEGHGLITSNQGYNGRDVSVGGGYGLFTLGYLFRPSANLRVYPQLGLGGGGLQLDIGSRGDANNFDEVLNNPNRSASVGRASLLVSLGGGLEYQFRGSDETGGVRLGLRAGYMVSTLTSDWTLNETTLSGGPDATLQGPFIRLTIGGGGTDSEEDEDDE